MYVMYVTYVRNVWYVRYVYVCNVKVCALRTICNLVCMYVCMSGMYVCVYIRLLCVLM